VSGNLPVRRPGQFLPGVSGNPGGRPRLEGTVRALAQKHSRRAVMRLVALLDSDNPRVSIAAANSLLDRAIGRPQSVAPTNGPLVNLNVHGNLRTESDAVSAAKSYLQLLSECDAEAEDREPQP